MPDTMKVKRRPPNQQIGTPMDLYDHPANLFVAIFLGVANVVTGNIAAEDGRMIFRSSDGAVVVPAAESARESNSIIFRPQNLTIGITCL